MVLLQQKLGGALKEESTIKAKENYASKSGKEPEIETSSATKAGLECLRTFDFGNKSWGGA